jgi:probable F420-dependent oxidoreductase
MQMEFGVGNFPTFDGMSPGPLARMVEDHGLSALFFPDHTHVPATQEFPGRDHAPHRYVAIYDLYVAMTAAAVATRKLRIGSAVCLVVQRDPIVTAKTVASIDHLSGGRVEFGVAGGWARAEMENHGVTFSSRMSLLRERVEAIKSMWTQREASYHGEHVNFDRIWVEPKPAQRPHPPILIGGDGPGVIDRVLRYGDGWFPNYGLPTHSDPVVTDALVERIQELHARADRPLEVQVIGLPPDPALLERLQAVDVRRASHWLPSGARFKVERALETWTAAINDFNGT